MTVNVSDHLYRNRIVRDLNGDIIDWQDEANGGWIIRKRKVVNQERLDELKKIQLDKEKAGRAQAEQVNTQATSESIVEKRASTPGKVEELEKKVEGLDSKIDKILSLLDK